MGGCGIRLTMRFMKILSLAAFCAALIVISVRAADTPLVNRGDTWRYHKGNTPLQSNWKTVADGSLDGTWLTGPGGFGYANNNMTETGLCKVVLGDMFNTYTTVYMRKQFTIASPVDTNLHLFLSMDFDDGFIAWLDGVYLTSQNVGSAPAEPATNAVAGALHESSRGSGGNPALTNDLGAVGTRLGVGTHTLAIIGLNESAGSSDCIQVADLFLAPYSCPPNSICADTNWTAAASPYVIASTLTVAAGATLTIEPGVTVQFGASAGMTINGRLLAVGDSTNKITFTRSGASGTWSHLLFNANSTTSHIVHAEMSYFASSAIEGHNTALHLDSINWTNSTVAAVDLHTCSVVMLNSYIPGGAGNEPVHFSGMPPNGHALIKNCVFGAPRGYNDSIDFTGGNRPGPIVQFIDNVFLAGVDDCFDMDATDAHIEGNIFMNVLQDDERESSSNPISTGEGSATSELVITRNIFFNCEHSLLLKDGGATVMQNNTIVHLVTNVFARTAAPPGGQPIVPGIIQFGEPWRSGRTPGHGAIYEGNLAYDLHPIIQTTPFPLYDPADSFLVVSRSLIQNNNWPGVGNLSGDPLFANLAGPMTAQNIRSNLALLAGSPCLGTGPNGLDMGALVPAGASVSGAPASPTTNTTATLPVAGPGIWSYKWRLNGGAWSAEVSLVPQSIWNGQPLTATMLSNTPPIALSNLTDGDYTVEVIGRNSAGFWQETNTAASVTWTVATAGPLLITNPARAGSTVTFSFVAQAGQTYSVFYRDAFDPAHPWTKHSDIPAQGATGSYLFTDSTASPARRFYRVVNPAQP